MDREDDFEIQDGFDDEGYWKDLLFTPLEAPVFGGQSIFISCSGHSSPFQKSSEYYLLFEGSNLRHITTTKYVNPFTLQAIIPDHDIAETVGLAVTHKVNGDYIVRTEAKFTFLLDMTTLLAQSLAMNSTNSAALKQIDLMYSSLLSVTSDERKGLDHRLVSAFEQLQFLDSLNLYDKQANWTLFHFCAKHEFLQFAEYLCRRTEAAEALLIKDENGLTPIDIATANENIELMELFSRSPLDEKHVESEAEEVKKPVIRRHNLGTTTITNNVANGDRDFKQDAKLLEDLNNLALESKKHASLKKNRSMEGTFSHPLASSLQKLREINLEIQRLRCLTQAQDELAEEMLEDRRARSFSCPDSFEAAKSERSVHGLRRYSTSLSSCDEENGDVRPIDLGIPAYTHDSENEIGCNSQATSNLTERSSLVDQKSKFISTDVDDVNDNSFVLIESEMEKPKSCVEGISNETEADIATETVVAKEILSENETNITDEASLENVALGGDSGSETEEAVQEDDTLVLSDKENCASETTRYYDADESCLSATFDESTIERNELKEEDKADTVKISDEADVEVTPEKDAGCLRDAPSEQTDNVQVGEGEKVGREASSAESGGGLVDASDDAAQQDVSANQQEFRGNSIVSESRMLTAVTEETEEELLELDGKHSADICANKSHSLEELKALKWSEERMHRSAEQVCYPREVVLRRGILKKDRPLSDNLENIKMIARESQVCRLRRQSESDDSASSLDKRKSKSLDMLLVDDENRKSPSLTSSQLSLSDIHGSVESMDRSEASNMLLYRTKSIGSGSFGHRASLNDITFTVRDDIGEPPPMMKKIRSRFSFKRKSKSTTALDKKGIAPKDDDRRKTIMGGIGAAELYPQRRSDDYDRDRKQIAADPTRVSNRDSGIDSTCELHIEDIILATAHDKDVLYTRSTSDSATLCTNSLVKNRNRSLSEFISDRDTEDDDLEMDTDEGTSSEIAEMVRKNSVCTEEKKKEKKFGLLRKGKKDKKQGKEKDREAAEKALKKSHKESKTSFLGKKHSFRQGPRNSVTSSASESRMFARASSMGKPGTAPVHSSSMDNLKGSGRGRPSPVGNRKIVHEVDGVVELEPPTNLISDLSSSLGSLNLEEVADAPFNVDDLSQYDSDLDIKHEPETWSDLVEKKVQRKLHAKDIKRQDVIYELMYTESNYVRTLKIVSRIYSAGFRRELGMDKETIEALFPRLDDLLEINGTFCDRLKRRQAESNNNVVEEVGDILVEQFGGQTGERMKEVYGYFCSRHLQAVALYKELMKTDKKFALFVRKCMLNERVRRLSIPECITLATQRLTKYPLLFEAILKATKESKSDYENVKKSIGLVKGVLMAVDDYVRDYEKQQQLFEIRKKFDPRGETQYKNGTFKNSKLFNKRSLLIHDGNLTWKGKSKTTDVRAVLLADKIFFCHEKDQRYSLVSLDNKPPVIYLRSLLARAVATDKCALFLVNNEGPEMYELVCPSQKTKDQWMQIITRTLSNRTDEEEDQSDLEEEMRKEEELRVARLKEIMDALQVADYQFVNLIAEKNKLVVEMKELIEKIASTSKNSTSSLELTATDVLEGRETLEKAITEASSLTTLLYDSDMHPHHESLNPSLSTTAPKRAETFGGFDRNSKVLAPPIHVSRASSLKQENRLSLAGRTLGILENDCGMKDPKERLRKTSQGIMSVIGRNKPNESNEDLSSTSSSTSNLSPITSSTAQKLLAVTQLKEYLTSLMDITNKQDIELASIRVELHGSRAEINKLKAERGSIEEKLSQQEKNHERQMARQRETSSMLERTIEKLNKQVNEYKYQQQVMKEKYSELQRRVYTGEQGRSSKPNSQSSVHKKHHVMHGQDHAAANSNHRRQSNNQGESGDQDVIFF